MQVPLDIAFHNMEPSEFIEAKVRERVDKLERYCDRITRCSVGIEAPHRAHRQGTTSTTSASRSACPARSWW
jgi:ribosome-associated translation inhibitor RaiA